MADINGLARDARDGDRAALARFVTSLQPDVWCFCVHVGGVGEAVSLAQDALMRIIANLHRWEREPITTWALGVTRTTCLESNRRRPRRPRGVSADPATGPVSERLDTGVASGLLRTLPLDQREAIVLTQLIGLPYAQAADVVGCSIAAIRTRVASGRDALAESLHGGGRSAQG